ncbi:MAG: hypothetical protein SFV24_21400 [Gemmatimonadales bacterium]|nr:hypothetical protein [Gemmatimonadales bacterium]
MKRQVLATPPIVGIAFAQVADDGGFLLVSVPDMTITRTDSTGRIEWRSGRKGEGPGEYLSIDWVGRGIGEDWVIYDARSRRLTTLGTGGEVVEIWTLSGRGSFPVQRLPNGDLVAWRTREHDVPNRRFRTLVEYVRIRSGTDSVEQLMVLPGAEMVGYRDASWREVELGAAFFHGNAGTRLVYAATDRPEMLLFDSNGVLDRRVTWSQTRTPLSAAVLSMRRSSMSVAAEDASHRAAVVLPEMGGGPPAIADSIPLIEDLVAGRDGHVWVRLFDADAMAPQQWWLFDSAGALAGSIRLPADVRVRYGAAVGLLATRVGETQDSVILFRTQSRRTGQKAGDRER